jgi:hypothetical protein
MLDYPRFSFHTYNFVPSLTGCRTVRERPAFPCAIDLRRRRSNRRNIFTSGSRRPGVRSEHCPAIEVVRLLQVQRVTYTSQYLSCVCVRVWSIIISSLLCAPCVFRTPNNAFATNDTAKKYVTQFDDYAISESRKLCIFYF